jgi:hypothetical protein
MSYHCTHVVVIEIPEGSWDTEKISKLIGATQGPKRLPEARGERSQAKGYKGSRDSGHLTKRKVMYVEARRSCFWVGPEPIIVAVDIPPLSIIQPKTECRLEVRLIHNTSRA